MSGLDGIQTLHRIKTAHPRGEVIMLTGFTTPLCQIESMRWGARAFLSKPVDFDQLLAAIDEAVAVRTKTRSKPAA